MSGCKMSEFKSFDEFQQGKRTDKISESQVQKEYKLDENSSLLRKVDFTKEKQKKKRSRDVYKRQLVKWSLLIV